MKKFLIAALVAVSGSANAADVVYNNVPEAPIAPAVAHVFSWEGAYFGAHGGADVSKGSVSASSVTTEFGKETFGYVGGFAGYNFDATNNWIIGLEGNVDYKFFSGGKLGAQARGRVGYAFGDALVYTAIGYGFDRFKESTDLDGITLDVKNVKGMTYGAGMDYAVSENLFARVDYRFNDYRGKINANGQDISAKLNFKQHVFGIGFGVKF